MSRLFFKNIMMKSCLILGMGLLYSCSAEEPLTPTSVLRVGTVKIVKANGEYFRSQIVNIENNIIVWESEWDEQVTFRQKSYQNIFLVGGNENGTSYFNNFNHEELEALFPLKVGNEVVFKGEQHIQGRDVVEPFWAAINVTGEDVIYLEGEKHKVLTIETTIEQGAQPNTKRTTIIFWHDPDLGLNLRSKFIHNGQKYEIRVVKIEYQDNPNKKQNNVGTTLVQYDPSDDKIR